MGISKDKTKRVVSSAVRVTRRTSVKSAKIAAKASVLPIKAARKVPKTKTYQRAHRTYKKAHATYAATPHEHLMEHSPKYAAWHTWRVKNFHHGHVHFAALSLYILFIGVVIFNNIGYVFAADLSDNWDFSTPSEFQLDAGVETSGASARLKAQEYANDGNTAALYPFNESSGATADDASSNNNDLALQNSPSFGTGNLNNGLTLNGTNQYAQAADSASLSMTGQQTVEGWIKPDATFDTNSTQNQSLVDKGSYKLGLDRTSGKAFYEVERSGSQSWTKRLGDEQAGSWSFNHHSVDSMVSYGTDIIAGTGLSVGDGEVWRWNGTTWTKIGGDGIRSSWPTSTYERVLSMAINGTALYAGLGSSAGDAEVWSCELATNCTAWTKIAGDGNGPGVNTHNSIDSMTVFGGSLYIGGSSTSAGAADVWRYNGGTSWTQVGGDGLNSSWAASTYELVDSMTSDGTFLYAGLGVTINDAEVWRYDGTTWTKIGGDGLNSSWASGAETVTSLNAFGGNLYAGLGNTGNDALVWRWNGTSWTQIAGAPIASTWNNAIYTQVNSMTNDGTNLYVGLGTGSNAAIVWRYNGTTWTQIGGGGSNGSTSWGTSIVGNLVWANSKLYASPWSTTSYGSGVFEYNGSAWSVIGGWYVNNSWGGADTTQIRSSTVHNGKVYYGLGSNTNNAVVFEYDGTSSRIVGGAGIAGSWPVWTYEGVYSLMSYKGQLYAGLGAGGADGEVWRWDGTSWTKIGGDGVSSSWNSSENTVLSMAVFNGNLYIGLGSGAYGGDLWQYNGSTWTLVAGEPANGIGTQVNGSWNVNPRGVEAMTVYNGQLCAGLGGSGAWGEVWCWSGSGNWTKIGGANGTSVNGSWSSSIAILALAAYKDKLYATVQTSGQAASIWEWNGSAWTRVAGGDVNGSWSDGQYTWVRTLAIYNGYLYAGTGFSGSSNPTGDVWRWDGTSWAQVGGDGVNGSWTSGENREEIGNLITYKGKLYAGAGYTANTDALVYSFGDNAYVESSTTSFGNQWHHLAGTYDGAAIKLFVNGTQEGSVDAGGIGIDNNRDLLVGTSYGSPFSGVGNDFIKGQVDEVRISNTARTSFNSKPYSDSEQAITLLDRVRDSGVESWDGFTATETANGGTVTYQLSDDDGITWKYWNGSAWVAATGLSQANSASDVNANIGTFPVTFSGVRWQAVLKGNGSQRVQLDDITLTANSDSAGPGDVTNIEMFKNNGGDEVASNAWTNASTPYITWDASTDGGSGVLGYCLYLGTSSSADPAITKGVLGTNPVNNGGNCQFTVNTNSVDLSTSGYLGSALTTSNSPYYLIVSAIDNAGNVSTNTAQFQFRFDNTAPSNPGFITAPSQFVSNKEVTFTWPTSGSDAPDDDNSGLAGLQYRIGSSSSWYGDGTNGDGFLTNDGSYTTRNNPDYANINEGNNIVYFRTWDQAGNVTTNYATAVLKLNTTSPGSPQNVTPTPTTNTTNSFAFSWSPPASFSGSVNTLTYCYTVNTAPTVNTCTFTNTGVTSLPAGAFATQPGENTFYVVAKDEAGNINYATAATTTFTANTSAPGIPLELDVADVSIKSSSSWRLALTWADPSDVGAGVAAYRIYRSTDNSNFSQVASTSGTSYVDTGLNQDEYFYKVKACDSANNCGADSATVSETPTGKFTTPANMTAQPSVSGVSTKKATIKWATDRVSDSKISLGTKPGEYAPFQVASPAQVTDHTVELNNLTPGTTYYAKASWTDEDGNTGNSSEFSFKTSPAPSTQEVLTQRVTLNSAQVRFTSVSAAKVVIQYGKSDTFGGVKEISTSLSKSTYDLELTGLDDGSKYFYRLNTFDAEGNEYTGSTVLTFTTPARPRIENLRFQPVEGEPTSTQQITWRTNVPSSSLVRFAADGGPGKEVSSSELAIDHEIIVRDLLDDTLYSLVAESRDKDGNLAVSDTQSLKTALDTRPPKISDVTVETTIRGSGAEARGQVIVSWKTDEPATSQVAYAEGSNAEVFNNKTSEDAALSLEHIVIVSDLPTSRVYSVQPISKDRSSNQGTGESKSAIIGRASDSVITIVLNTLRRVFGF